MRFGGPEQNFHVSDWEFDRIHTKGTMRIGGDRTEQIRFNGISRTSWTTEIQLVTRKNTRSNVTFEGSASTFVQPIKMIIRDNLVVNANMSTTDRLKIITDNDCSGYGSIVVATGTMVTAGKQVDIEAQDIVMDGLLKATDMPITIRTCVGRGVTIGGPGQPSHDLELEQKELQQLRSTNLTFITTSGPIRVFRMKTVDTQDIKGIITLNASGTGADIAFEEQVDLKGLYVVSWNGITINSTVTATESNLRLNSEKFVSGDYGMRIKADEGLVSWYGTILLQQDSTTPKIHLSAPTYWEASEGITVGAPVDVDGEGRFLVVADREADGKGTFVVESTSNITLLNDIEEVTINAGDLRLECHLQALNTPIEIQPSPYSGSLLALGLTGDGDGLHVSDWEADRLHTTGTLTLGGNQTERIKFDGLTYTDRASSVRIWALKELGGNVTFHGTATTFAQTVYIVARDSVDMLTNVTVDGHVDIITDAWCEDQFVPGTFTLSAGNTLSSLNNLIEVTTRDIVLEGVITAGTDDIMFTTCNRNDIGIGGTMPGTGLLNFKRSELQNIICDDLKFESPRGVVSVHYVESDDTKLVTGAVTINASSEAGRIVFNEDATFKTLLAYAGNGTVVKGDLTTTVGDLLLEGDYESEGTVYKHIDFKPFVQLHAKRHLVIQPSATGRMRLAAPNNWTAWEGISVYSPIQVVGAGAWTIDADLNNNGTGKLLFAATSNVTTTSPLVKSVTLVAGDMDILCDFLAYTADVHIKTSVTVDSTLSIGGTAKGLHLRDFELDFVDTNGTLMIGGVDTAHIVIDGLTYAGKAKKFIIDAMRQPNSTIEIVGTASNSFVQPLIVNTRAALDINASVSVLGTITIDVDADCNAMRGTAMVGPGVTITSNDNLIYWRSHTMHIGGQSQLVAGTMPIMFSMCPGGAIDIGGDGVSGLAHFSLSQR